MRSEAQVLAQLLDFARAHAAIRAVVMNGSRVNPAVRKDLFCDYDVVYYVPRPGDFLADQSWLPTFGELVMLQQNDEFWRDQAYCIFLMLFADGVRIDLSFQPLAALAELGDDTLTTVLLDKDGLIPPLPPPCDAGYYTPCPGAKEFSDTLNEILWCSNNVAKGLWRGEPAYVKHMLDAIIRPCVLRLLAWEVGERRAWQLDSGKFGKWLGLYLPAETWQAYLRTYAGAGEAETWQALFALLELVRQVGGPLAARLGYAYPADDHRRLLVYLEHARALPKDAVSWDADGAA